MESEFSLSSKQIRCPTRDKERTSPSFFWLAIVCGRTTLASYKLYIVGISITRTRLLHARIQYGALG
jgi:hypothetical protein